MIEDYNKIANYINDDMESIFDELKSINNEIVRLQLFLDNMKKHNSDYEYSEELFNKLEVSSSFQKFHDTLFILERVDYHKLDKEPQLREMLNLLDDIEKKLFSLIDSLKERYIKVKEHYDKKKKDYEEVMVFIDDVNIEANDQEFLKRLSQFNSNDTFRSLVLSYVKNRKVLKEETSKDSEHVISRLNSSIVSKIKDYLREFYKLSLQEKNSIISANDLINEGDYSNLMYVAYGFSHDEIIYYVTIYNLIDYFNEYIELINSENSKTSLVDIMEKINGCLKKLDKIQKIMKEKEHEDEQLFDNELRNIVLFLDITDNDNGKMTVQSVTDVDLDYIRSKQDGDVDKDFKSIIRMLLSRFKSMDGEKFKKLGHHANKMIINYENKIFKELNVWCSKGSNSVRIPYSIVGVSEKNKKEIIEKYHLPSNANIYLVFGLFTKKNDDSEYVRVTGSRLKKEYDAISFLLKLFQNDFDELSRIRAFKMIDNSLALLDGLENVYDKENVK